MSSACDRFREELLDVAAGAAGSPELPAHLESCTACRSELDDLAAIVSAPAADAGPIPATRAPALVREDLAAVQEIQRRAPFVIAGAMGAGAVGLALVYGVHVRPDLAEVPVSFLVASIGLLFGVGAIGVWLGARLTALSARAAAIFVGLSVLFFVGYALLLPTTHASAEEPAPGITFFLRMLPCFVATCVVGVFPLVVTATLLRRARFYPPAAALATGIGAGMLAMPAVEVFCHISASSHVLLAHGAGIAFTAGLAWATFAWIERRRLR